MSVDGLEIVGVTNNDIVSVAPALEFGQAYLAVKCGSDGVAHVDLEVDTFVHAAPATAVAVGRSDVTGVWHGVF